jgi:hypothetical protein
MFKPLNIFNDGVGTIALDKVCFVIGQTVYFEHVTYTLPVDKVKEFNEAFVNFKQLQAVK